MSDQSEFVQFRRQGHVVVGDVSPQSMKDVAQMKAFGDHVIAAVSKHKGLALMLNFERVGFLSSAALTELIRIRETLKNNGGALRLCGLSRDIYKVFEITKLDGDFGLKPDEDVAHAIARYAHDVTSASAAGSAEAARG